MSSQSYHGDPQDLPEAAEILNWLIKRNCALLSLAIYMILLQVEHRVHSAPQALLRPGPRAVEGCTKLDQTGRLTPSREG